jgi:hypothetical protein
MIEFEDAAISEEIFRKLRQEPPYAPTDLEEVSRLILSKRMWGHELQTLSDLRHLTGLRSLYLENVCGVDFAPVFEHPSLTRLLIEKSDLSRLEGLQSLVQLEDLTVSWNFIEDISPILEMPVLESLEIYGNPLTPESYYEILPQLEDRFGNVYCDDEETWKLQRRMWEQGHRACFGNEAHYRLIVPELCCRLKKSFAVRIEPEELEAELAREGADIEEIAERRRDKPYRRGDHIETGDAEAARGWIETAEIDDRLKEALREVVDRLEGGEFVREDEQVFEEMQGRLYYWKPYPRPEGGRPQIPAWYRAQKSALSYFCQDGEDALVMLAAQDLPEALDGAPVALRPVGVRGVSAKKALTDRWAFFPIAYAGTDANLALGIRLGAEEERRVYVADLERALSWEFDPFEVVAFEDIAGLFEAIDTVVPASQVDGRIAQLGDEPAAVAPSFDLAEHRVVMERDEAREHVADCELDEELRESLEAFVAELPETEFVREDDAYLDYWEVSNQTKFPAWYRQLRKAVALPVVAGTHPDRCRITFDHPKLGDESYVLSPPGVHLKSMRRKLIDEAGALPIAYETHRLLLIRLGSDDRTIYELDPSYYQPKEPFHAFDSRVFANPAQMFDAIATVSTTVPDGELQCTQ